MDIMPIKCVDGHSDVIKDARYSPDATLLATASVDNTVKIWNMVATLISQLEHFVGLLSIYAMFVTTSTYYYH
jgi:WD40 repeat protein